MSSQHTDLSSTLQRYYLRESDVLQPVSNDHLQEISRSHCRKWRSLPVALDMENHLIWEDIDHEVPGDEEGRRNRFFSRWQSEKGSDANYRNLINALLVIGCRQDAEYVCGLLNKAGTHKESADKGILIIQATTNIIEPGGYDTQSDKDNISDKLTKENFEMIKGCFATLVDDVSVKLSTMNINMERFRTFVANLFPPGDFISDAATVIEIFTALTQKCLWDHSSYRAFESIYKKFGKEDEELKMWIDSYKAELAGFMATTKIIDYIKLCNTEDEAADSEESISQRYDKKYCRKLAVKIGEKITQRSLEYVNEFWKSISEVFHVPSLPAVLESIHEGCTEITWIISAQAVSQIESAVLDRNSVELISLIKLFQQFKVISVAIDERILYEKELKINEFKILMQELEEKDGQIKMLGAIVKRRNEQIAQLQNELKETEEQLKAALEKMHEMNGPETGFVSTEHEVSPLDLSWSLGPDLPSDKIRGYIQSVVHSSG